MTQETQNLSPFFRADCGCIILKLTDGNEHWIIHRCDADHPANHYDLWTRVFEADQQYTQLSLAESKEILEDLARLIQWGYQLKEVMSIIISHIESPNETKYP